MNYKTVFGLNSTVAAGKAPEDRRSPGPGETSVSRIVRQRRGLRLSSGAFQKSKAIRVSLGVPREVPGKCTRRREETLTGTLEISWRSGQIRVSSRRLLQLCALTVLMWGFSRGSAQELATNTHHFITEPLSLSDAVNIALQQNASL